MDNKARVEELLIDHGGLFTFQDIIDAIVKGDMQGFVRGESWAVTKMADYPRRRVIEIVLVVGQMDDIDDLHNDIIEFGRAHEATLASTTGREGWHLTAKKMGWTKVSSNFVMEIPHG